MVRCVCLVQQGQRADQQRETLTAELEAFCQRVFGDTPPVNWIAIAPGSGFTAGEPSTSSIISITAPAPLAQPDRARMLGDLCDMWMAQTGCSMNEVMAVVSDPRS